jgi:DNA-binding CsgD family transcriptional regulator
MTTGELRRMAELWAGAMSVKQIAREMGYSPNTVRWWAHRRRDLFPARSRKFTQQERDEWADRFIGGELTADECARRAGCTAWTVYKWARERRAQ